MMATSAALQFYLGCCISSNISKEIAECPDILTNPTVDEANNTVLHYFAYEDHVEDLRALLSLGMDPNHKNKNGETALHWAAKMGCVQSATVLLEFGIDVDAQDLSGSTALHCAIENGIPELIPVLIGGGCNSLIADGDGKIPMDIANENADINSEYFATQLLLERSTTVPVLRSNGDDRQSTAAELVTDGSGGSTMRAVKKGDIVFVRRRLNTAPSTAQPSSSNVPINNQLIDNEQANSESNKETHDTQRRVQSAGPERNNKDKDRAQVLTKLKHAPPALTPAEEQALREWKQKKKQQEEARRAAAKKPFYSRAAFSSTFNGGNATAAEEAAKGAGGLMASASTPAMIPHVGKVPRSSSPNKDKEIKVDYSVDGQIDDGTDVLVSAAKLDSTIEESRGRPPMPHLTRNNPAPVTDATLPDPTIVDPTTVCFLVANGPSLRKPGIWMKLEAKQKASLSSSVVPISTPAPVLPVNISLLQDLESDIEHSHKKDPSPQKKPLWFVSKDPASYLERSPSPSATLRHATLRPSTTSLAAAVGGVGHGNTTHTSQKEKFSETVMDIKPYIPFLPSDKYARCLDVYISVEVCHNCREHTWLAWHDEQKYLQKANQAIETVLSAIVECGFPVRVFAYKAKADHTRLAALEVNIAVRTSAPKSPRSNNTGALDSHLQWLSGLSQVSPDHGVRDEAYERDRLQGLRGDSWSSANLHSKLLTSRWPSKRQLQMRTIMFLSTALCGIDFAVEYSKLLFFDKKSRGGRCGIGIFRRGPNKTKSRTGDIESDIEAITEQSAREQSYQIDVVQLFRQWKEFTAAETDWKAQGPVGYLNDPSHGGSSSDSLSAVSELLGEYMPGEQAPKVPPPTTENLEVLMKFVEQRRGIRSKLVDAMGVWNSRLNSSTAKSTQSNSKLKALPGQDNATLNTNQSTASKQVGVVTALLGKASLSDKLGREIPTWGQFFDPIRTRFSPIKSNHSDNEHAVTLGPSAAAHLVREATSSQSKRSGTVGHLSNALASSVHNLAPMSDVEVELSQLHALWLYFVLDHTPCAALEYVPPFVTRISTVAEVVPDTQDLNSSSRPTSVEAQPTQRVTLRIERKPNDPGLPKSQPNKTFFVPNYLLDDDPVGAQNISSKLAEAQPSEPRLSSLPQQKEEQYKLMVQRVTKAPAPSRPRSRIASVLHVEPQTLPSQIASLSSVADDEVDEDDVLEQEYNSLVQSTAIVSAPEVEPLPVPIETKKKGKRKKTHREDDEDDVHGSNSEDDDENDDEENEDDADDEDHNATSPPAAGQYHDVKPEVSHSSANTMASQSQKFASSSEIKKFDATRSCKIPAGNDGRSVSPTSASLNSNTNSLQSSDYRSMQPPAIATNLPSARSTSSKGTTPTHRNSISMRSRKASIASTTPTTPGSQGQTPRSARNGSISHTLSHHHGGHGSNLSHQQKPAQTKSPAQTEWQQRFSAAGILPPNVQNNAQESPNTEPGGNPGIDDASGSPHVQGINDGNSEARNDILSTPPQSPSRASFAEAQSPASNSSPSSVLMSRQNSSAIVVADSSNVLLAPLDGEYDPLPSSISANLETILASQASHLGPGSTQKEFTESPSQLHKRTSRGVSFDVR